MRVKVDTEQIRSAIAATRMIANRLESSLSFSAAASLAGFSPIDGFSTSGRTLGTISDVHAPEATEAVATHLLGIADTLQAALDNTIWADGSFSGTLASLGNAFGKAAANSYGDIIATSQILRSVDPKTNAFSTPPAPAGFEASLLGLHGKFMATEPTRALAASEFWVSNAALISQAMEELNAATSALASSAETEWVARGIETIQQVQNAGRVYSANSTALATHAKLLTEVSAAEKVMTEATVLAYNAAPNPALKESIELGYLAIYQPRATGGLATTVPQFNRLLPDFKALPGGSMQVPDIPVPSAPAFDQSPIPKVAHDVLTSRGLGDVVHAKSPGEVAQMFGNANPEVLQSIAAGATPTQAASAAAPTMPPPSTLAQLGQAGGGMPGAAAGAGPAAGTAAGFTPAGLGGVGGPGAPGAQGRHALVGPGGAGQFPGPRPGGPGGTFNGTGLGASGNRNAGVSSFGGRSAGGFGAGTGAGTGTGAGAGMGRGGFSAGAGGFGSGSTTNGFGSTPGSLAGGAGAPGGAGAAGGAGGYGSAAGSAPGTHASGAHGPRSAALAGAPMGMAGRNQDRKDGAKVPKVKTVTSAVEREGNLKALLGDAPLLLPQVIGHNVRE